MRGDGDPGQVCPDVLMKGGVPYLWTDHSVRSVWWKIRTQTQKWSARRSIMVLIDDGGGLYARNEEIQDNRREPAGTHTRWISEVDI